MEHWVTCLRMFCRVQIWGGGNALITWRHVKGRLSVLPIVVHDVDSCIYQRSYSSSVSQQGHNRLWWFKSDDTSYPYPTRTTIHTTLTLPILRYTLPLPYPYYDTRYPYPTRTTIHATLTLPVLRYTLPLPYPCYDTQYHIPLKSMHVCAAYCTLRFDVEIWTILCIHRNIYLYFVRNCYFGVVSPCVLREYDRRKLLSLSAVAGA